MRTLLEAVSLDCPGMGPVGPQDAVALELFGRQISQAKGLAPRDYCLELLALPSSLSSSWWVTCSGADLPQKWNLDHSHGGPSGIAPSFIISLCAFLCYKALQAYFHWLIFLDELWSHFGQDLELLRF